MTRRVQIAVIVLCLLAGRWCWAQEEGGRQRAEALVKEARSLYETGRPAEALTRAQAAVLAAPEFAEAHRWVGFLLSSAGEKEEAVAAFARAVQYGDESGYVKSALSRLLYGAPPVSYLEAESLPYLPVEFRRVRVGLTDPGLGLGAEGGVLAVYSVSAIYTPTVPCSGPDGEGTFNRISYVFIEGETPGRLTRVGAVYYGSEFLWNTDWGAEAVVGAVAEGVARLRAYGRYYSGEPVEAQTPVSIWLYPGPGEDSVGQGEARMYGALQGEEGGDWTGRAMRVALWTRLVARGTPARAVGQAALEALHIWEALNATAETEQETWAALRGFLGGFPPKSAEVLGTEEFIRGLSAYLAATERGAPARVLLEAASDGKGLLSAYEQACLKESKRAIRVTLPFRGTEQMTREQVVGAAPLQLAPEAEATYWAVLGEGRWRLTLTGQGTVTVTCDGTKAAEAWPVAGSGTVGLGELRAGWHKIVVRNAGGEPASVEGALLEREGR